MEEEWLDVVGWEGYYKVSNFGRVMSLERVVRTNHKKRESFNFPVCEKILAITLSTCGYSLCKLSKNRISKSLPLHRLVAIAFIPNPNNYREVNHIDGNKQNNNVNNLEWCTRGENVRHSFKNGLNHGFRGTDHAKCRFTEDDVYEIRERWDNGERAKQISIDYNCSKSAIEHIGRRRLWKHLI